MTDDAQTPSFADDFLWVEPERRRAHPLWRLLAGANVMTFLGVAVLVAATALSPIQSHVVRPLGLSVTAVATVHLLAVTLDEGRSLRRYGFDLDRSWATEALEGVVLAVVAAGVPSVLGLALGWYEPVAIVGGGTRTFVAGALPVVLHVALVAFWEELFHRGVVLTNLVELVGTWSRRLALPVGVLLGGWWFASVHEAHPDRPELLLTWVLAGVVFSGLYLASGRLALPVGAHCGYNLWHALLFSDRSLEAGLAGASRGLVEVTPQASELVVGSGGLVQALGFVFILVLGIARERYRRGSIRNRWRIEVSHLND